MFGIKLSGLTGKLSLILSIVLIVMMTVYASILLRITYTNSLNAAEDYSRQIVQQYGSHIEKEFFESKIIVESLQEQIKYLKDNGKISREEVIGMLQRQLESKPNALATYTLWEPNAFDGKDEMYANKPGHDGTGRLIPYVVRSNGKIIVEPIKDYDKEGAGDFYLVPKKTKKPILMDPYPYEIDGKNALITSLIIPILDQNANFLGIIGIDFTVDYLQDTIAAVKPMGGFSNLISNGGTYIANGTDASKRLQNAVSAEQWNSILGKLKNDEQYVEYKPSPELREEALVVYHPIHLEGIDSYWAFQVNIPKSAILASFNHMLWLSVGLTVVALLVVIVISFVTLRHHLNPIQQIAQILGQVSQGDLRVRVKDKYLGNDEIGILGKAINSMVINLREMISQVTETAIQVSAASEELTASAKQVSKAAEHIAKSSEEAVAGSEKQVKSLSDTQITIGEMSEGMQRVAAGVQSVSSSAGYANEAAEKGNEDIQLVVRQMESISTTVNELAKVIEGLGERSEEIGNIVGVITEIAAQTNLLALNAAIEAARAGEQGRGFAVVADEVRKLAEQSAESAQQIAGLISGIQNETNKAMQSMTTSIKEVSEGIRSVHNAGESFEAIQQAAHEAAGQAREVSGSVEQIAAGADQIVRSIRTLNEIAEEAAEGAQNISAATEEQLASMEEIEASASSLSKMATELQALIQKFKI